MRFVSTFFVLTLVLNLLPHIAYAKQIVTMDSMTLEQQPKSNSLKSDTIGNTKIELPPINVEALKQASKLSKPGTGAYQFAVPVTDTTLWRNKIQWQIIDGIGVYRVRFSSSSAVSMNIGLHDVFLPYQSQLFFYTPDGTELARFDHTDNKSHGQLWSPVLNGDEIILEVNTPASSIKKTRFKIAQVAQGFQKIDSLSLKSGNCNINTVCPEATPWQSEVRSVARIVIAGSGVCTGTLLNNTDTNGIPYFLSANHCGISMATAPSIVFYWNYEASLCDSNTIDADGSLNQFQTGSTFRAAHDSTDLALVELDSAPDSRFNVHYAGWNNSPTAPLSAVAIHHPNGDEKRISFDNDPLTIVSGIGELAPVSTGSHLRVGDWDLGTTEVGSSGSAIWDENHFVVGTLHGGQASCSTPLESDWYGRLAAQWEGGGTPATQLKAWLDPQNTGAETLPGQDACDAPVVSLTLDNATPTFGDLVNATVSASGGAGGNYSFSWDFNGDGLTDATGNFPSYFYTFFFEGNISVLALDSAGCAGRQSAAITVIPGDDEVFLANRVAPQNWTQTSGSAAIWTATSGESFEGDFALQAEQIADNEVASIETNYNFIQTEANFISFAAKVSSESGYDFFQFYIDDELMLSVSGERDWGTFYFPVSPGSHKLTWAYEKDFSVASGADTAWLDGVVTSAQTSDTSQDGSGSSGGGTTGPWMLVLLLILLYNQRTRLRYE